VSAVPDVVFLLDVDNTLLDNDRVISDLRQHLERTFGVASSDRYFAIFEALRWEFGYADYLGALQRYRVDSELGLNGDPRLLEMSDYLIDYPFADVLYAGSLAVIERLNRFGPTVILSDGDAVFQPRKVRRSGIRDAVEGRVLIYIHKEAMLDQMRLRYPARHYVMVDDKLRILTAMKSVMGNTLTTVFVHQGHYALDPAVPAANPVADVSMEHIGDLLKADIAALFGLS
jgi:FMN phosphatase YigB (HAD superfamily)